MQRSIYVILLKNWDLNLQQIEETLYLYLYLQQCNKTLYYIKSEQFLNQNFSIIRTHTSQALPLHVFTAPLQARSRSDLYLTAAHLEPEGCRDILQYLQPNTDKQRR